MSSRGFKESCVPLVGLRRCFYYSMCCIARQFGDRQGVPRSDGVGKKHVCIAYKTYVAEN